MVAFLYLKVSCKKDGDRIFSKTCCNRTTGKSFKLKESKFTLDIRKNFLTIRVVKHCNRFPRKTVDAPSLETFKTRLHRALSNLV